MPEPSLGTVLGLLKPIFNGLSWVWKQLSNFAAFLKRVKNAIWPKDLIITPITADCWWHLGGQGSKRHTQIVTVLYFFNRGPSPIRLLDARTTIPKQCDCLERMNAREPIERESQMMISFNCPDLGWELKKEQKISIVFTDHLKRKWYVKGVSLTARNPDPVVQPVLESLHSISSPIEKQVAAFLKAEVQEYNKNGRQSGGLGSLGKHGTGFNPYAIKPVLQAYELLKDAKKRGEFIQSFLDRLTTRGEYGCVAYYIVLVLLRIEQLEFGLEKAREAFKEDDTYAFGDTVLMLTAVIRDHPHLVSEQEIDEVDRFADDSRQQHEAVLCERLQAAIAKARASGQIGRKTIRESVERTW